MTVFHCSSFRERWTATPKTCMPAHLKAFVDTYVSLWAGSFRKPAMEQLWGAGVIIV